WVTTHSGRYCDERGNRSETNRLSEVTWVSSCRTTQLSRRPGLSDSILSIAATARPVGCSDWFDRAAVHEAQGHPHPAFGPQRYHRQGSDRLLRKQLQVKFLQDHGYDEAHFQHGELVANALVRPAKEWEVCTFWAPRRTPRRKAIGIEHVRVRPNVGM